MLDDGFNPPRRLRLLRKLLASVVLLLGALALVAGTSAQWKAPWTGGVPRNNLSLLSPKLPDGRQRAFPSAQGFGAGALGGRGGRVIFVDTLAEEGEGSLRACIDAAGPRTCVFRLSGTITLDKASLVVRNPYLTIAGETAPGDGIAIRNSPLQLRPSIEILTHDVVMRFLRLRPGPHSVEACCSGALGIYGDDATDIIIDHISASWGSDETVDSENARNVTIQWSMLAEPLLDGGPGKRNRARNMYLTKGGNFSIHHNLFAFGRFRNPQFQQDLSGAVDDVVNNVIYSPEWDYVITFSDRLAPVRANVVGNYKLAGFNDKDDHLVHLFEEGGHGFQIYLEDNYDETYRPDAAMTEDVVLAEGLRRYAVSSPHPAPSVYVSPARENYDAVLADAGATKPKRDVVDLRVVDGVRTRSRRMLENNPEKFGGWPDLVSLPAPADGDRDGMPDDWETDAGLNPADARDGTTDRDGDGWTNFEEYLHMLAGEDERMAGIAATR